MKKKEVEELPPHIVRFEKIYNRYRRNYAIVVCLVIIAVVAIWYFFGCFWGLGALFFSIWSNAFYESGAHENCIDEHQFAHPWRGFRKMFKSWVGPAILAAIIYFFYKLYMAGILH